MDEAKTQQRYYAETARNYDEMHVRCDDAHYFALRFLLASLDHLHITSVLDVGAGTGRAVEFIKKLRPDVRMVGIEPVRELREVGFSRGLSREELVEGDATAMPFDNSSFDLVCESGVLHHLRRPERAVSEMLRVAGKAIFISDSNNFGEGARLRRSIKQIINLCGLWPVADLIKTKGKGYTLSEGDGLAYSYSVFNNYNQIADQCSSVHILNTKGGGINPYRAASHVALLGVKKALPSRGQ
jgi:SAM-dependent methyltransferase